MDEGGWAGSSDDGSSAEEDVEAWISCRRARFSGVKCL
jgi:hypothetical protein